MLRSHSVSVFNPSGETHTDVQLDKRSWVSRLARLTFPWLTTQVWVRSNKNVSVKGNSERSAKINHLFPFPLNKSLEKNTN